MTEKSFSLTKEGLSLRENLESWQGGVGGSVKTPICIRKRDKSSSE